jgi:two-component system cell cycle sensor histidine kinase/response regulator CckA
LRGFIGWGTQDKANAGDSTPIMTQLLPSKDNARAPVDGGRPSRGIASIALVLLFAFALMAAVFAVFIGRAKSEPYTLALIAVLATLGGLLLLALAARILGASGRASKRPLLAAVVDHASEGTLVTDAQGRVVYANAAYLELVGASGPRDVRPVERVFMGDAAVSEAVYRLLRAAREGRRAQEEVRVSAHKGERGVAAHPCAPARGRRAPVPHDGVVAGRRDARPRTA